MTPMIRRLSDFAIVLAVSAGISLLVVVIGQSWAAKSTVWKAYQLWLSKITQPDIIVTALLAIAVTMAVIAYQQNRGKR